MFLVPEPPLTGCGQAMCVCLCTAPRVLDKAVVRREGTEWQGGVSRRVCGAAGVTLDIPWSPASLLGSPEQDP